MTTFKKSYQLPYAADVVYQAWTSSDTVIAPAEAMQIEPIVGGAYKLIMPGGMAMNGEFLHVEPGRSFSHTWQWQGDDSEPTTVHVALTPRDDGTEVEITHGDFADQQSYDNHASGWDNFVQGFSAHLASS